jgi:two-component system sensor histidine kinase KdpD
LGKAEAVRESERLKSVLLDAITHDFKTPLTSIKASATGLLEDVAFNKEQRRELLVIIDEECDRINRLIGETAEMAQLEAGDVTLQFATHTVDELIYRGPEGLRRGTKHPADTHSGQRSEMPRVRRFHLGKKSPSQYHPKC